jgi:hypothetical protein
MYSLFLQLFGFKASLAARSLRGGSLFVVFALASFLVSPIARAVDPPPDGGYPGGNTAEGEDALLNLASGVNNTADGFEALFRNTSGNNNTAIGFQALFSNSVDQNGGVGGENTATGSQALFRNTGGGRNTATGFQALLATRLALRIRRTAGLRFTAIQAATATLLQDFLRSLAT